MELAQDSTCIATDEQNNYELLQQVILNYDREGHNLIQVLHMAQAIFGYLPEPVLRHIGTEMNLPMATIHGVVSFYSYFNTQPKGRHTIQVCLGTACYVRGGQNVLNTLKDVLGIDVGQTTSDQRFSLEVKRCIGSCGLAPAILIDKTIHKRVNPNKLQDILRKYE